MLNIYYIVKCSNCGMVQYIRKGQKTRTCPKCHARLKCKNLKIFDKATSIQEASQIVRSMKSPNEIDLRLARLMAKKKHPKTTKHHLLGQLISELVAIFPKAIPKPYFIEKAKEIGLELDFIETILSEMNKEGYLIINKDFPGRSNQEILQFPTIPFKFGKIYVKKPTSSSQFRRISQ